MKKALIFAVLAILVVCMGCQAVQSRKCTNTSPQQVVSSETPTAFSSLPSSVELEAEPALLSSSQALKLPADLVKAAVPLDWNKYHLKDFNLKTVNGKKYHEFEIWDEDYAVGPFLLIDPEDGKVYSWAPSDSRPILAAKDKAFDKTPRTITGVIKDSAMMSILLKTDDGSELTVRRLGVDTTGLKSMVIGAKIKVTYTGVIKGSNLTRAFVTKLENVA